jgi:hypothetical protein
MSHMGRSGWAELSTVDHERGRQQGRQQAEKTRDVTLQSPAGVNSHARAFQIHSLSESHSPALSEVLLIFCSDLSEARVNDVY